MKNGWRRNNLNIEGLDGIKRPKNYLARDFLIESYKKHGYEEVEIEEFLDVDVEFQEGITKSAILNKMFDFGIVEFYGRFPIKNSLELIFNPKVRIVSGLFDDNDTFEKIKNMGYESKPLVGEISLNEDQISYFNDLIPTDEYISKKSLMKITHDANKSNELFERANEFYENGMFGRTTSYLGSHYGKGEWNKNNVYMIKKKVMEKIEEISKANLSQ